MRILLMSCIFFLFLGCTMSQKGAAVGTVTGAGLGAIIGHQSGHTAEGAGIGAAVGAAAGTLIGENMAKKFCPKCGRDFTEDLKYCPYDGTELKFKEK